MKHFVKGILLGVLVLSVSACDYFTARRIPTLGTTSNSEQCPPKERIYFYRGAGVAMCLPDVMVAYTHCVTELTLASDQATSSSLTKVEATSILEGMPGIALSNEQKRDLIQLFENKGLIGAARARAIRVCEDITTRVFAPAGEIAPTIEAAEKEYPESKKSQTTNATGKQPQDQSQKKTSTPQ